MSSLSKQACVNIEADVTECLEIMARDNRICELEQVLKGVTSEDVKIDCSRSDKEAMQLFESNVIVKESVIEGSSVPVKQVACGQESEELCFPGKSPLDKLIKSASSLYALTKRVA